MICDEKTQTQLPLVERAARKLVFCNAKPLAVMDFSADDLERIEKRFRSKIKVMPSGCWEWQANIVGRYGHFKIHRATFKAHRVAYALHCGSTPSNLSIDHLCRNTISVNPSHLAVTSLTENILRGFNPMAINARKTHCPRGHPYDYQPKRGQLRYRGCRICANAAVRKYRAEHREELLAKNREYHKQGRRKRDLVQQREWHKAYRLLHREEINARSRASYHRNKI